MGLLFGRNKKREQRSSYSGPLDDPRFWTTLMGGGQTAAGVTVSPNSMRNYMIAMACVSLRARTIASLRAYVGRYVGSNRFEDVPNHPLNMLLDGKMNPDTGEFNFFETLVHHIDLWGNFYAIKQNTIRENTLKYLWQIPTPGEVEVRIAKNNEILSDNSYAKPRSLIYIVPSDNGQKKYSQNQIVHVANFSQNGITGMSQISLYKENAGIALAQQNYVGQFYDGGIVPPGLLSLDGRLGDNAENMTKAIQEQWKRLGKESNVAVLEDGIKYTQLSMSMADAETVSSREFQGREFCGFLGVPPHMVGLPVSTSYNSLESENEGFKGRCILPLGERISKTLSNSLLSDAERLAGLRILFDYDTLLRADAKSRATYYRKMLETGMSPNSIMRKENLAPVDGGDQSFVPANLTALDRPREPESEIVIEETDDET